MGAGRADRCLLRAGRFWPGFELGFEVLAFLVEFGEASADAGAVGLGGWVGRVGGQIFQFQDLGVLRGLDPGDPGFEGGFLGVPVGGSGGVGGGDWAASRAARSGPKIRVAKKMAIVAVVSWCAQSPLYEVLTRAGNQEAQAARDEAQAERDRQRRLRNRRYGRAQWGFVRPDSKRHRGADHGA